MNKTSRIGRNWSLRLSVFAFVALVACGGGHDSSDDEVEEDIDIAGDAAPLNDGRLHPLATRHERALAAQAAAPGFMPTGDPNASSLGVFGPVLPWKLMPIHQILLPDGRVLTYGSDTLGRQGGGLHYAVWDPALGTGDDAFLLLPTVTGTNIFCAGQALLPETGDVLIVGGTTKINDLGDYGVNDTNVFAGGANVLSSQSAMAYRRWYPTLLTLASGDQLALGGRMDRPVTDPQLKPISPATFAATPEYWSQRGGWHALTAATSDEAFGSLWLSWYYPRAWVSPAGKVFIVTPSGTMFQLNPEGNGELTKLAGSVGYSSALLQSVMYQPGKIISIRQKQTVLIDINSEKPVVSIANPMLRVRQYGNATLLADGQVWLNGGSSDGNVTTGNHFVSETWNPATGQWSDSATATVARLYHSSSLLLPDATVVTGGGGDPGPYRNLNAEIYYPPYLYLKDGTGKPAPRPVIQTAPAVMGWNQPFTVEVSDRAPISRVTLVRTGTVTHDFNSNQRFQELAFTQQNGTLSLTSPATSGIAPPGYYMLFVFDGNGVPSIAKIIKIAA